MMDFNQNILYFNGAGIYKWKCTNNSNNTNIKTLTWFLQKKK